ncbi:helix-turn-helix transcriptional regulator [Limosilactobacillus vaginalis]|uniref:helix-turn-helix transcriptional regulator n=1 Tax=Limosilactobacillus vaginalis TaxID=1633 RepID=UPI0024B9655B|nr:hypothetical protein [Limosilactobacillus vaginalis]
MFGKEILNGKELMQALGISTTLLYQLLDNGLPYHQLSSNSRKYYNLNEVEDWLRSAGYRQKSVWTN